MPREEVPVTVLISRAQKIELYEKVLASCLTALIEREKPTAQFTTEKIDEIVDIAVRFGVEAIAVSAIHGIKEPP